MRVASIVMAFNPQKDIVNNINSYLEFVDCVYVIDNTDSKDNSSMFESCDKNRVKYVPLMKNTGCEALNIGCKLALGDGYDHIMLLDQDTQFEGDGAKKLITFAEEHPEYACVTPNIRAVGDDGSVFYTQMSEDKNELCNWTTGSGQIISLDVLDRIGYFDEKIFLDHVDVDLGIRVNQAGYKTIRVGNCLILQRFGHSQPRKFLWKTVYPKFANSIRVYYVFRNQIYLYKKYGKAINKFTHVSLLRTAIKILLYENNRVEKFKMALLGIRHGKKGIMGKYTGER